MFRPDSSSIRTRPGSPWLVILLSIPLLALVLDVDPASAKKKKKKDRGEITGTVENQDGKTLEGVAVDVLDAADQSVAETTTDKKGSFEVEIAEPSGTYRVEFSAEGFAPFSGEVELEPGSRQELTVKLIDEAAGQKNRAIAVYNEGAAAHRGGDLDQARIKFSESVELDPSLAPPWLGLADVYLQQGQPEKAVEAAEAFVALQPDDEQGKKVAFEAYRRAGMDEKAKEMAAELGNPDMSKDVAIGVYNEGAAASQSGDYEVALAKFRQAAELDSSLAAAHAGVASILYNQSDLEGALEAANQALERDDQLRQALRIRYLALDARGDLAEAGEAWEQYRAIDEAGAVDLLYRRAKLDFEGGDTARAQAALGRVLELQPDFARGHYLLGLTFSGTNPAKAKEHLAKFIELAPDDPEVESAKEIMAHL